MANSTGDDPLSSGQAGHSATIREWLAARIPPGTVLALGTEEWPLSGDHTIVRVVELAAALQYEAIFDHVWINDALTAGADPAAVARNAFRAMKPDGRLVVTVPHGLAASGAVTEPFYLGRLRRLLAPLFELREFDTLDGYIVAAGRRREQPTGPVGAGLDPVEAAFRDHEQRLQARLASLASELSQAQAERDAAVKEAAKATADLRRATAELEQTRPDRTDRRQSTGRRRWWPIPSRAPARVPDPAGRAERPAGGAAAKPPHRSATANPAPSQPTTRPPASPPSWREDLQRGFEAWLQAAQSAEGDEVVVMFSGTTFVQGRRGNRPIRLTNVYLSRGCPVFFNYYRWSDQDPLPEHPDKLLFQSPIDATPDLLHRLLSADFGGKKKIFYASFPHELMVRYLTLAGQLGWVTVYDTRDDWEEFAKVGMAKWHHLGYEQYVATHADIVTAVSRPLAKKISALAGGRTVHVVPNGLDRQFPRPASRGVPATPTIGYFGHLTDRWFDWQLVIDAAKRYPDYRFELAGHQQPDLTLPSNVELLGLLSHPELAERSKHWSIGIIPFKNGPLADAVDPIKVYEYLHLGLPVLATYFPQCRDYPGTTITEGRDEFLERIPELIGTRLPQAEVDRWLAANTWECRVDTYTKLADELRAAGRSGAATMLGGSW
ncbi:MAG TPA: hypothetical protein VIL37_10235 [Natronosporangium sp.]